MFDFTMDHLALSQAPVTPQSPQSNEAPSDSPSLSVDHHQLPLSIPEPSESLNMPLHTMMSSTQPLSPSATLANPLIWPSPQPPNHVPLLRSPPARRLPHGAHHPCLDNHAPHDNQKDNARENPVHREEHDRCVQSDAPCVAANTTVEEERAATAAVAAMRVPARALLPLSFGDGEGSEGSEAGEEEAGGERCTWPPGFALPASIHAPLEAQRDALAGRKRSHLMMLLGGVSFGSDVIATQQPPSAKAARTAIGAALQQQHELGHLSLAPQALPRGGGVVVREESGGDCAKLEVREVTELPGLPTPAEEGNRGEENGHGLASPKAAASRTRTDAPATNATGDDAGNVRAIGDSNSALGATHDVTRTAENGNYSADGSDDRAEGYESGGAEDNGNEKKDPKDKNTGKAAATISLPTDVEAVDIDTKEVERVGGLAYAELCKERAREKYKDMRKNEHLANGNFDRLTRRKKNDKSMSDRQKYNRRLRMNQDSAAAARHAQEVFVSVLAVLVGMLEDEKKTFSDELDQIRSQKERLEEKVAQLQAKVEELEEERQGQRGGPKGGAARAKFADLFGGAPAPMGAPEADVGIQPARAV